MKDVNWPLRKCYFSALSGITYNSVAVPVYYSYTPNGDTPDNYIVFGAVTNTDASTKNSADTFSSMRVTIHTRSSIDNSGRAADAIAASVFDAIYPNSQAILDMSADDLQMVHTELSSDNTQDYTIDANKAYIDRILIFSHYVCHGLSV